MNERANETANRGGGTCSLAPPPLLPHHQGTIPRNGPWRKISSSLSIPLFSLTPRTPRRDQTLYPASSHSILFQIVFPFGSTLPRHSTATALSRPPIGARYFIVPRTINSKGALITFFHFSSPPSVEFTAGPKSFYILVSDKNM